jgi:F-type H+-transporting ATPase subunit epsilon
MQDKLELHIVSPVSLIMSGQVTMVVVPGIDGYFGVLSHHMPFLTVLRPGLVEIYDHQDATTTKSFFVEGGVAEVNGQGCSLLVDSAIDCEAITPNFIADRRSTLDSNIKTMTYSEKEKQMKVLEAMETVVSNRN